MLYIDNILLYIDNILIHVDRIDIETQYIDPAPPGVIEARRKFAAQMMLADSSKRVKCYTREELIGVELLSRDDQLKRPKIHQDHP